MAGYQDYAKKVLDNFIEERYIYSYDYEALKYVEPLNRWQVKSRMIILNAPFKVV